MQDRPHAGELSAAVREFIDTEILPTLDDPRLRFRALVAANGLGILERELAFGPRSSGVRSRHLLVSSGGPKRSPTTSRSCETARAS